MKYKAYAQRVFCSEWSACVAFYKDVLGLPQKFASEEMGWAEFDLGGVSLGVERADDSHAEHSDLVGRFVGLSLEVDDIFAVYDELKDKGVVFTRPPESQPWGGVLADFQDPAGNVITLLGSPTT